MAKKQDDTILTLGDTEKLTVQKCFPLYELWRSDYGLGEFKILDTYLGRIDSHEPKARTVRFDKGELEDILGVDRVRIEDLDKRLKTLCTPIRINDLVKVDETGVARAVKKFVRVSLFEKAVAEQDRYGVWQIELTCTESAIKYFFNVESIGYLRYKLRCITALRSRYTYIMFIYLETNRKRGEWVEDLDKLRYILNCDKEETYSTFKRFNEKIMKRVKAELDEKTACRFEYEPIKRGRRVTAVKFRILNFVEALKKKKEKEKEKEKSKTKNVEVKEEEKGSKLSASQLDQQSIPSGDSNLKTKLQAWNTKVEEEEVEEEANVVKLPDSWKEVLNKFNLTEEELDYIRATLYNVPEELLPLPTEPSIDTRRYHYMMTTVAKMGATRKSNTIKNYCRYITAMINTEVKNYNKMMEELNETDNSEPIYDRIPKMGDSED